MKPPWSLSHSAWSLGWLLPLLAWIKVTYLRWGRLLLFCFSLNYTLHKLNPNFPFIHCREPAWWTPPTANIMRKEASAYTKAGSSLRKPPVPEHLPPKPESAYFTVLCSHLHLWLYGGLTPTTSFREGVNLQLQVNKNSWAWQECFNLQTPLKFL